MTDKKITLIKMAIQILQENANQKFTTKELAEQVLVRFPAWCAEKRQNSKQGLSTDQKLIAQIRSEIKFEDYLRWQKKDPNLQTLEEKPRKFFYAFDDEKLTVQNNSEQISNSIDAQNELQQNIKQDKSNKRKSHKNSEQNPQEDLLEHELYPLLAQYLHAEYKIYSKRIDEKRSSNKRGAGSNKWLFPDIVALELIGSNWQTDIRECAQEYFAHKSKLWSFEVKRKIDISNVREVFFQTVSNSSWANYAYLVASNIVNNDTIKELRILAGLHGVGVIHLDAQNPTDSQILIPARESNLDWDNADRLAKENQDFKEYITDITAISRSPSSKNSITKNWLSI